MAFYGSTLMWLMSRGKSLAQCTEFTPERIERFHREEGALFERTGQKPKQAYLNKNDKEVARLLLNGCAQYAVAERLAAEWGHLDSNVRMRFTDLANAGWRSGNKTKGLLRLDKMLGGKILRREYVEGPTAYDEFHGRANARDTIAYKFAALPADYASWSPAKKNKYRAQLARERRTK